jgi:hypothetical protein
MSSFLRQFPQGPNERSMAEGMVDLTGLVIKQGKLLVGMGRKMFWVLRAE